MPKIKIEHKTQDSKSEVYKKIKSFFEQDKELRGYDSKIQYLFNDNQMTGEILGSQVKGDFQVDEDKIKLNIEIPFLLSPFKGKIEDTIKNLLTKHLV